ncbi:hypothetical protein KKC44_03635 [Patescibacteria group bacterium]|nr:hypothetical protein [Patescibacteria group bacterium]MBU2259676.1 hypothetical protein [Patescibacteria group bacterium]
MFDFESDVDPFDTAYDDVPDTGTEVVDLDIEDLLAQVKQQVDALRISPIKSDHALADEYGAQLQGIAGNMAEGYDMREELEEILRKTSPEFIAQSE